MKEVRRHRIFPTTLTMAESAFSALVANSVNINSNLLIGFEPCWILMEIHAKKWFLIFAEKLLTDLASTTHFYRMNMYMSDIFWPIVFSIV